MLRELHHPDLSAICLGSARVANVEDSENSMNSGRNFTRQILILPSSIISPVLISHSYSFSLFDCLNLKNIGLRLLSICSARFYTVTAFLRWLCQTIATSDQAEYSIEAYKHRSHACCLVILVGKALGLCTGLTHGQREMLRFM